MKKYILNSIVILLVAVSCVDDDFIDSKANKLTVEEALENTAIADEMIFATYNVLTGYAFTSLPWVLTTTVPCDNAIAGRRGTSEPTNIMDAIGEISPSNTPHLNGLWTQHYVGVTRANQVLKRIPPSTFVSDEEKEKVIAEARFLRALCYYRLSKVFGGVPLITKILTPGNEEDKITANTRVSREELYEFIVNEFKEVSELLPMKSELSASDTGRATKGAAIGYLAKTYMYIASEQQTNQIEAVIDGKDSDAYWKLCHDATIELELLGYDLDLTYAKYGKNNAGGTIGPDVLPTLAWQVSSENNIESLFEVQGNQGFNTLSAPLNNYYNWASSERNYAGMPNEDIIKIYEFSDRRLFSNFAGKNNSKYFQVTGKGAANTRLRYFDNRLVPNNKVYDFVSTKSYISNNRNVNPERFSLKYTNKNIRLLRYADILLIRAEAANELGFSGDAETQLNYVRLRAFGDNSHDVTPGLSFDDLQMEIWKERRLELAFEHDRWFDLGRQGRRMEVMNDYLESMGMSRSYESPKHDRFPIPHNQILLSGGLLEQNPCYGDAPCQ